MSSILDIKSRWKPKIEELFDVRPSRFPCGLKRLQVKSRGPWDHSQRELQGTTNHLGTANPLLPIDLHATCGHRAPGASPAPAYASCTRAHPRHGYEAQGRFAPQTMPARTPDPRGRGWQAQAPHPLRDLRAGDVP